MGFIAERDSCFWEVNMPQIIFFVYDHFTKNRLSQK